MRKLFTMALLCAAMSAMAFGQGGVLYTNATSTGTTLNSLASINTSNQALLTTTSQTTVPAFIVIGGAGTSGSAALAVVGIASCTMDTTIASGAGGYFVIASTTTGADCHPQSAAPSAGTWVVGYLAASSTSSGSAALVQVNGFTYGGSGGGTPCTTTANSLQYDNSGAFGCTTLQDISNDLSNTTSTQAQVYQGGQDASANAAGGGVTLRGAAQTGTGGSSSAGGSTLVAGGQNAATSAASAAGNVELQSGQSTASSSTGLQGLMLITHSYAQSGTVTQWGLVCHTATANTVTNCGSTPQNIAGVAVALSGTVEVLVAEPGSEVPINASAAVTLGDAVYAGGTATKVTDCGGTSGCANGIIVGQVIATTGTWQAYPDGTAFPTLSTTLPLIKLANLDGVAYVNNANGQVNITAASSFGVGIGSGNGVMQVTGAGASLEVSTTNGWSAGSSFATLLTFPLKATAALTAGQVVKSDTSNAESVVVATTTDTGAGVPISFVTNSPGTGAVAHIAAPGSLIYTPKLGTGTCTLGQFVIVDTTTNGDVKCTGTYTAGTILGRVIVAQSTVGSAVGVFVWPQ